MRTQDSILTAKMTTIRPFEKLPISTATYMIYSNLEFNLSNVFKNIPITKIDPPLTKKKKNIDKKKITADYGSVIGVQYGIYIRGIRTSKEKKYWCTKCQKMDCSNNREKKILTVKEVLKPLTYEEMIEKGYDQNTKKIHFVCSECNNSRDPKNIVPFLNQVTIVLCINNRIINSMMFNSKFKLAGNKLFRDAVETLMIIWEEFISKHKANWKFINDTDKDVHFLYEQVMRNVDFKLGFPIDKRNLNSLMNKKEFSHNVHLSKCEPTSDTHVNIKMYTKKPENFYYNVLSYENANNHDPKFIKSKERLYAKEKSKSNQYITFIVFSSAEIILTGRYNDVMKEKYEFFVDIATKYKEQIEEVVVKKNMDIRDYLNNLEDKNNIVEKKKCVEFS